MTLIGMNVSNQPNQCNSRNQTFGLKKAKCDGVFSCGKCDYSGASMKLLNEHYVDQHDPVHCRVCNKQYPTLSSLKRHMYKHADRNPFCGDWRAKFAFPSELAYHRASHKTDRDFQCMYQNCSKTFKVQNELNKP